MDGESRYIKEVLDWYRDEDAGDLRRTELNELVEIMTRLNALEGTSEKSWEIEKRWKSERSNQNIVMNEEYVKKKKHRDE